MERGTHGNVGGGGIVSVTASGQYSGAIPSFQVLEHLHHAHASEARVAARCPEPSNGEFVLDDAPGLAVEIDEAGVERFSVDQARSEDGRAATPGL